MQSSRPVDSEAPPDRLAAARAGVCSFGHHAAPLMVVYADRPSDMPRPLHLLARRLPILSSQVIRVASASMVRAS
jgi:hypothetical protein